MAINSITTIAVDTEVRDKLIALGKKNETYNQILRRILGIGKQEE